MMVDPKIKASVERADLYDDIWSSCAAACGLELGENSYPKSGRHLKGNWSQMGGACRLFANRLQSSIRKLQEQKNTELEKANERIDRQAQNIVLLAGKLDETNREARDIREELADLKSRLVAAKVGHFIADARRSSEERTAKVLETVGYEE